MRVSIAVLSFALVLGACETTPQGGAGDGALTLPAVPEAQQAWGLVNCLVGPGQATSTYSDSNQFDCAMRRAMAASDERVTVNFTASDPAFLSQSTDGRNIRGLLPARMERWAEVVTQTGGKVVVCRQDTPETWAFALALARWLFGVVRPQLLPGGQVFYLPARNRDMTLTYAITNGGAGARLVKAEFDRRPVAIVDGCDIARTA